MTVRSFMPVRHVLVIGLAMVGMALGHRSEAATLQYQMTGTASGSLNSVSFTNQPITLTMLADPANVVTDTSYPIPVVYLLSSLITIDIAGQPQAIINNATYALFSYDLGTPLGGYVGFGELTNLDTILGNQNNDNPSYNLGSPATVTGAGYASYSISFSTSVGNLIIDNTSGNAVLTVTGVPEPSTVALSLSSGLVLAALARRKRAKQG